MQTEEIKREYEAARIAYNAEIKRMNEAKMTGRQMGEDEKAYKAWLRFKKAEEKMKSHGAEDASDEIYSIYFAIRRVCFEKGLPSLMNLYFMPEDIAATHADAAGIYGYHIIMINKEYYERHGVDDAVINTMFHEMCHAFCDMKIPEKQIKDTDGAFHLPAFAEVCKEHGGTCEYEDAESGYSNSALTAESMAKVKEDLRRKGRL